MRFYDPRSNVRDNAEHLTPSERYNVQANSRKVEFITSDLNTLTIKTDGAAGTGFWVNWGDGTAREWIAQTGTWLTTVHDYSATTGDKTIEFEGDLSTITGLWCEDTSLKGNSHAVSMFDNLTELHLKYFASTGNAGGIATLDNLVTLKVEYSSLTFALADIASMTGLTTFWCRNCSNVTGNIQDIAALTALTYIEGRSTAIGVTAGSLPAWSGATIILRDCAWAQAEVDNFLIKLEAGGGSSGSVNIAGTNAARSAASDAAKAALLGRGWAITVNE